MTGFGLVAGVIGIFFAAGIGVGVLIVLALPRLRVRRGAGRCVPPAARRLEQPPRGDDEDELPPPWPGR